MARRPARIGKHLGKFDLHANANSFLPLCIAYIRSQPGGELVLCRLLFHHQSLNSKKRIRNVSRRLIYFPNASIFRTQISAIVWQ